MPRIAPKQVKSLLPLHRIPKLNENVLQLNENILKFCYKKERTRNISKQKNICKKKPNNMSGSTSQPMDQILSQIKNHLNSIIKLIDRARKLKKGKRRTCLPKKTNNIEKSNKRQQKDMRFKPSQIEDLSISPDQDCLPSLHIDKSSSQIESDIDHEFCSSNSSLVMAQVSNSSDVMKEIEESEEQNLSQPDSSPQPRSRRIKRGKKG